MSAGAASRPDGHDAFWRVAGKGEDLVLLHGIGSSSDSFEHQFADLTRQFRVHAWDAPGYARSPDLSRPLSMDDYADAVGGYAAGLPDRNRVHLAGVSWGGVIAVTSVLRHPGLFASLTLISSSAGSGVTSARARAMRARALDLDALGAMEFARRRAPRLLSASAPAALVESAVAVMAGAIRLPGYRAAAEAMASTDLTPRLHEVRLPCLVLVGAVDTITGAVAGRVLAEAIPDAAYVPVRNAGHLVNQERPAQVNRLLQTFIEVMTVHD